MSCEALGHHTFVTMNLFSQTASFKVNTKCHKVLLHESYYHENLPFPKEETDSSLVRHQKLLKIP